MSDPDATTDDAAGGEPRSPTDHLVELQRLDTEIDQLRHRRERLPEADALAEARAAFRTWASTRDSLQGRIDELGAAIAQAEERTSELAEHTTRLEAQLKTVIAPREAEALMHEIATLAEERDAVETAELEALEEQTSVEDALATHQAGEAAHREHVALAETAAEMAMAAIDAEIAELATAREVVVSSVPAAMLARYDRMRSNDLVAVSRLDGRRCTGCHLDLSAAEVDDVKDEAAAADGVAGCPQCGRMLVI